MNRVSIEFVRLNLDRPTSMFHPKVDLYPFESTQIAIFSNVKLDLSRESKSLMLLTLQTSVFLLRFSLVQQASKILLECSWSCKIMGQTQVSMLPLVNFLKNHNDETRQSIPFYETAFVIQFLKIFMK